jgi:hypothetical protein
MLKLFIIFLLSILFTNNSFAIDFDLKVFGSYFMNNPHSSQQISFGSSNASYTDTTQFGTESNGYGATITIMEEKYGLRGSYEKLSLATANQGSFTDSGSNSWSYNATYSSQIIGADIVWKFSEDKKFSYFLGAGGEKHYFELEVKYVTSSNITVLSTSEQFGGKVFGLFKYFPIEFFAVSLEGGYRYAEFNTLYSKNAVTFGSGTINSGGVMYKHNGTDFSNEKYTASLTGPYVHAGLNFNF